MLVVVSFDFGLVGNDKPNGRFEDGKLSSADMI